MQQNLISAALELMALGMGTVFVFLAVLVIATNAMSSVLKDLGFTEVAGSKPSPPAGAGPRSVDPKIQRAIELAIRQYRREHGA